MVPKYSYQPCPRQIKKMIYNFSNFIFSIKMNIELYLKWFTRLYDVISDFSQFNLDGKKPQATLW